MKVLLVENKTICIDVLMALLSGGTPKQISTCLTVEEAEERLKTSQVDVIVVGKELASTPDLFKRLSKVPIVLVTDEDYMAKARRWTLDSGGLGDTVERAALRKELSDRFQSTLRDMGQRIQAEKLRIGM